MADIKQGSTFTNYKAHLLNSAPQPQKHSFLLKIALVKLYLWFNLANYVYLHSHYWFSTVSIFYQERTSKAALLPSESPKNKVNIWVSTFLLMTYISAGPAINIPIGFGNNQRFLGLIWGAKVFQSHSCKNFSIDAQFPMVVKIAIFGQQKTHTKTIDIKTPKLSFNNHLQYYIGGSFKTVK